MLVAGSNRRIFGINANTGIAVTGYAADGRQIINRARDEASDYLGNYGHLIVPSILSDRLSLYMHYFTIYGSLRPFGASALIAAYDEDLQTPELYLVDPSGSSSRYIGCAAGKGTNNAKTELEKILNKQGTSGITCKQAVLELARMYICITYSSIITFNRLQLVRDQSKEKPLEIEMGWVCEESGFKYTSVPKDLVNEADKLAQEAVGTTSLPSNIEEKTMEVVEI